MKSPAREGDSDLTRGAATATSTAVTPRHRVGVTLSAAGMPADDGGRPRVPQIRAVSEIEDGPEIPDVPEMHAAEMQESVPWRAQ
jgi:hypothetical protein